MPGAPLLSYGLKDDTCEEVSDGIVALAQKGARIVNLSLATTEDCFLLQLATAVAFATDTLVVAAAGNEQGNGNPVVYPAAYPHVLSVGAVDETLQPTFFSTSNSAVDLAAPGQNVPVAIPPSFDFRDGVRNGLTREDGTSFAAPIVAGVASWLLGVRPKLDPGQVGDILRHSARDLGAAGYDSETGFGLVDLGKALVTPAGPIDPFEPNDGIPFVDGTAFQKPDPYVWRGGRARTLKASVDPVEDPIDVYRIRLPARRRAAIRLTPSAGNVDLYVYDQKAKNLKGRALTRSSLGVGRTDKVRVRNRRKKARTAYVVVKAPSLRDRPFDAPYTLRIARG
jgi:hypothetical protein